MEHKSLLICTRSGQSTLHCSNSIAWYNNLSVLKLLSLYQHAIFFTFYTEITKIIYNLRCAVVGWVVGSTDVGGVDVSAAVTRTGL